MMTAEAEKGAAACERSAKMIIPADARLPHGSVINELDAAWFDSYTECSNATARLLRRCLDAMGDDDTRAALAGTVLPSRVRITPTPEQIARLTEDQLAINPAFGRLLMAKRDLIEVTKKLDLRSKFPPLRPITELVEEAGDHAPRYQTAWNWCVKGDLRAREIDHVGWCACPKDFTRRLEAYRMRHPKRNSE